MSADNALRRARVNVAEARVSGASDLDVLTAVVQALRGRSIPSAGDRADAAELLEVYAGQFGTPGERDAAYDRRLAGFDLAAVGETDG